MGKRKILDTNIENAENTENVNNPEINEAETTENPILEEPKAEEPKAEEPKVEEPKVEKKKEFKVGAKVKINKNVGSDIVGRRIHNGIKNYVYTIKVVRPDGFIVIECLTHAFTLSKKDLELV